MPALSKTQRKELEEGLTEAYPHLEPQLLGYLIDVYERDSRWLNDRMQAELRQEKNKVSETKVSETKSARKANEAPVPTP